MNKNFIFISSILCTCQIDLWKNNDNSTRKCWWSPLLGCYVDPNNLMKIAENNCHLDGDYDGNYYDEES